MTVLPGAPRTPSSWRFGCAQSPIAEMFWLPSRSIWVAPIITWRLPKGTTDSSTSRNGIQPSTTSWVTPSGGAPCRIRDSPSVIISSGLEVSFASRAPRLGSRPIGLPMISPSSAKQSAMATAQYSARVTVAHACSFANAATASW